MEKKRGNGNIYCNPLNMEYLYQFTINQSKGGIREVSREAADPSMIFYKGRYYLCASMTLGVWVSDDLVNWENHRLPGELPLYDYAPDIRVVGDYVYFCASKAGDICDFYRTQDVINGPYEKIEGSFTFWDPNLFQDDDGRVYFFWGCSNMSPILGVELDPETMHPLTENVALLDKNLSLKGFERRGDDHTIPAIEGEELERAFRAFLKEQNIPEGTLPEISAMQIKAMLSNNPFIEGAWLTKHEGKYYLQYAAPGTEYNGYCDGVYVSEHPLGPFVLANNNPYSYKPGGFITGAGHGSTMQDRFGNWWHVSTMRISVNQGFERRIGLWPAGFDCDGELFCNQKYGDWPRKAVQGSFDPWEDPEWMLLSYHKPVKASSFEEGKGPEKAADENIQTWWRAASAAPGEWIELDLQDAMDVHAVQINFADDVIEIPTPGEIRPGLTARYIDGEPHRTRWTLEYSADGKIYQMLADKSEAETDLAHDLIVREEGVKARYLRLMVIEIPYDQKPCISGLRVFGKGNGNVPPKADFTLKRTSPLDMEVSISQTDAAGYNILWGYREDKLYHSYLTYKNLQKIGALIKDQPVYVRVDSFNENGITKGDIQKL